MSGDPPTTDRRPLAPRRHGGEPFYYSRAMRCARRRDQALALRHGEPLLRDGETRAEAVRRIAAGIIKSLGH
jgi:hypothetical protein